MSEEPMFEAGKPGPVPGRIEAARKVRLSMRMAAFAYTVLTFSLCAYLFSARQAAVSTVNAWFAVGVILAGGLPLFLYLYRAEVQQIPLLAINGLFYVASFGLPVLSREVEWRYISSISLFKALEYTLVGVTALIASYYFADWAMQFKQFRLRLPKRVRDRHLRLVGYSFYGVHLLYVFSPAVQSIPTVSQFALASVWIGIGVLYLLFLSKRMHWTEQILLMGVMLPLEVMLRLTTAQFYPIVSLMIFLSMIRWKTIGRIPVTYVAAGLFLVVAIYPIKTEFRTLTWFSMKKDFSYVDKAEILFELLSKKYESTSTGNVVEESQQQLSNRLSHVYVFSQVVNMTPYQVPFWEGGSYVYFVYSYIPRFLWPEKPESTIGNEFGHRYGFLDANDNDTSWNLPWLVEFYSNFGSVGVVLGMAVIGLLFRFLVGLFAHPDITPLEYVFGLTVLFPLSNAESNLALMWSGALTTFVAFYLVLRLLFVHRN